LCCTIDCILLHVFRHVGVLYYSFLVGHFGWKWYTFWHNKTVRQTWR
jgi:hypothetical protein